jgi:hypothetical protein
MVDGLVNELEWINVCDDTACERNECVKTKEFWRDKTYEEDVSLIDK